MGMEQLANVTELMGSSRDIGPPLQQLPSPAQFSTTSMQIFTDVLPLGTLCANPRLK